MRDKAEHLTDQELFLVEGHLEALVEHEYARVAGFEDDPYTVHYGVASEMAPLVYARAKEVERALDSVEFEIQYRALRAWPQETEASRQYRREASVHPALKLEVPSRSFAARRIEKWGVHIGIAPEQFKRMGVAR